MLQDALALATVGAHGAGAEAPPAEAKRPSKETLNHPGLIRLASGRDPFSDTAAAYREGYRNLGIDLVNRVPEENAPLPLEPGEVAERDEQYLEAYLGVYNTCFRKRYLYRSVEEFWAAPPPDPEYTDLVTPVPHRLERGEIGRKMDILGEIGLYYYMLYTTLFMWAVEVLGWEVFLLAAAMDPQGFDEKFFQRVLPKSRRLLHELAEVDSPFVFCHDDLADARGPVFPPAWYERYIFPRYVELWRPIQERGKKVIFVADGNMQPLLGDLKAAGVDGVMLENPATDFEAILERFHDRIVIGGAETGLLALGTPVQVRSHVLELHERTKGLPGFVLSTPGGIHGQLPLANLEAYFDARVATGHTPQGWRQAEAGGVHG
jgi:hypothetical protein